MRLAGVVREQQDQTSVRAFETAARRIYPRQHLLQAHRGGADRGDRVVEAGGAARFYEEVRRQGDAPRRCGRRGFR